VGRVLFASLLGVLAAASPATGAVVEVTSTLPEWLAPGGRLAVSRWAAPSIERSFSPTARQHSLARVSFAAGAHIVLGSHPHVQQPRERFGARFVGWSLGNFVFGASSPGTERTGILGLELGRHGVLGHGFRRARIARYQPRLL
jgi:hypothetical protein